MAEKFNWISIEKFEWKILLVGMGDEDLFIITFRV